MSRPIRQLKGVWGC